MTEEERKIRLDESLLWRRCLVGGTIMGVTSEFAEWMNNRIFEDLKESTGELNEDAHN